MAALDSDKYIDIQSDFSWVVQTLTDKQRLFIFYYTYPFDNSARGNGAKAARLAGYSKKQAKRIAVRLLQRSEVQQEVNAITAQIATKATKVNLEAAVIAYIADKIKRTNINPFDYYTFEERQDDNGYRYTVAIPKQPQDLTASQRAQVLDIEYVGAKGLLHYKLPNKQEVENEVIKLWRDLCGGINTDSDNFEVEATADIIKDRLTLKAKLIDANKRRAQLAGLCDSNVTDIED